MASCQTKPRISIYGLLIAKFHSNNEIDYATKVVYVCIKYTVLVILCKLCIYNYMDMHQRQHLNDTLDMARLATLCVYLDPKVSLKVCKNNHWFDV